VKLIRIVDEKDADAIFNLRYECYSRAREFKLLQPECLRWNDWDRAGVVLAAYDDAAPISTTRALLVTASADAEECMGCSVDLPSEAFPAIVLGRGATLRDAARIGLHSTLRYYVIRSAIEFGLRSLIGMVYSNAPRTNLMRDIGYTFTEPAKNWDPEVAVVEPVMVAYLARERFSSACRSLEALLHSTLADFPWIGESMAWTPVGTDYSVSSVAARGQIRRSLPNDSDRVR
jgi:hypothetical protein